MSFDFSPGALRQGLILYFILVASLCIHEWAHAFVADRLGDDTPRTQGRVTLNPLVHMDLFGSVIFPLLCIFVLPGGFFFAWGRPVIINSANFTHRVRDDILTTAAGPISNLVLALLFAVIGGFVYRLDPSTIRLFTLGIVINVSLAVFNLIPLPPLDGGQILRRAVGMSDETFIAISRWSFLVLLVLLNLEAVNIILTRARILVAIPFLTIYHLLSS